MKRARIIFYLLTAAGVIVIFVKFAELRQIGTILLGSDAWYLPLVLLIQCASFCFGALNYRDVLMMKGLRVRVRELFPITYVVQFISQALPTAGLSGQVFFIQYLKKFGLGIAEGIGRAILEIATLYVAYVGYFLIATLLILKTGIAHREPTITYVTIAFLVFVLLCAIVFFLSQRNKKAIWVEWILQRAHLASHAEMIFDQFRQTLNIRFLREHAGRFWSACLWQVANLFTHVITLYTISYALGSPIPFVPCFIAFTFSKFLSMISIVPGAPGVFEAAMTLILVAFGVPAAPALAATLLTRAFTFWLPMPIGWVLYNYYTKKWAAADTPTIS